MIGRLKSFLPEILVGVAMITLAYVNLWSIPDWEYYVLTTDGRGYYAYLPATFIHNDLSFQTSLAAEQARFPHWTLNTYLHQNDEGQWFNKYFPGWAFLTLPMFLIAWLLQSTFGTATGYETTFLVFIHASSLMYGILGYRWMRKLIGLHFPRLVYPSLIAALVLFGTNLIYYAALKPTMTHVHSFAMISLLFLLTSRWRIERRSWLLVAAAFVIGLIVCIRPTNAIVALAIPAVLVDRTSLIEFVDAIMRPKLLMRAALVGFLPIVGLIALNMMQVGSPLNWSYKGEGFYWLQPAFLKVLLSFRNGWWMYSPLAVLAFGFLLLRWKTNRWQMYWLSGYWFVVIYLIAAWWNWYYGGGYGHRAFVDHYAVVGWMLAGMLDGLKGVQRKVLIGCSLVFLLYNALLYQRTLAGILPIDHVNREVFLGALIAGSSDDAGRFSARNDIKPFGAYGFEEEVVIVGDARALTSNEEFGFTHEAELPNPSDYPPWYFEVDLELKRNPDCDVTEFYLVFEGFRNGEKIEYIAEPIYYDAKARHDDWRTYHFGIMPVEEAKDAVKVYIWNRALCDAEIRNFRWQYKRIEE